MHFFLLNLLSWGVLGQALNGAKPHPPKSKNPFCEFGRIPEFTNSKSEAFFCISVFCCWLVFTEIFRVDFARSEEILPEFFEKFFRHFQVFSGILARRIFVCVFSFSFYSRLLKDNV